MTHGSLFSGIGGFDLAAEWMGWQNVFHCEWNVFGQRVLKYYWPNAISYNDITKTDFTIHRGRINILTGGFPCQPYSMAGKRLGKEDDRHLWPEMLRAIREIQPRWVVGENVIGLVNWSDGLVFHEVQADLEAEGYEVQPFVLPAVSVNAPHRRDRIWFVAKNTRINGCVFGESIEKGAEVRQQRDIGAGNTERVRGEEMAWVTAHANGGATGTPREGRSVKSNWSGDNVQQSERREQTEQHIRPSSFSWDVTDTNSNGQHGSNGKHEKQSGEGRQYAQRDVGESDDDGDAADTGNKGLQGDKFNGTFNAGKRQQGFSRLLTTKPYKISNWEQFPSVSPICDGNDGISDRLDGITFSKWRQESIKAGGNAIVPQVVLQIFRTIEEYEKMNTQ